MRATRTNAVLDVPPTVYAAVSALLARAGYDHCFGTTPYGEVIDMFGIALRSTAAQRHAAGDRIEVGSLLSATTKEGRVELVLNGEIAQMDLPKAREVVGMLQGAIEAAATDQMLFAFLTTRIGLAPEAAAAYLLDFREMRQGSRHTVNPS
jgi:hypothetical protein